jgi:hypothetical protein
MSDEDQCGKLNIQIRHGAVCLVAQRRHLPIGEGYCRISAHTAAPVTDFVWGSDEIAYPCLFAAADHWASNIFAKDEEDTSRRPGLAKEEDQSPPRAGHFTWWIFRMTLFSTVMIGKPWKVGERGSVEPAGRRW